MARKGTIHYPITEAWKVRVKAALAELGRGSQNRMAEVVGCGSGPLSQLLGPNGTRSSFVPAIHDFLGWPPPPEPDDAIVPAAPPPPAIDPAVETTRRNLVRFREEAGFDLYSGAFRAGLPAELLERYERGEIEPPTSTLRALGAAYGRSPGHFLEASPPPGPGRAPLVRFSLRPGASPEAIAEAIRVGEELSAKYDDIKAAKAPKKRGR